ncbi:MAG: acyl-CoA desaturase [Pseudomonadota bacterium]
MAQREHGPLVRAVAEPAAAQIPNRLPLPSGVMPLQPDWPNIFLIGGYHIAAVLAFLPIYFTWTGVIVAIVTARLTGLIGINVCYHRLLTHRGFTCPKWLEHAMVVVAICCVQDTPARWVAVHRRHHQHADDQPDPHSPLVNFFWGHIGWVLFKNPELSRLGIYDRYAKDILRDRFYVKLERNAMQLQIIAVQWAVFFILGFAAGLLVEDTLRGAALFGASIMLWGVAVRTVFVWHQTWAVNSITHLWGYRNYETDEDSRNNLFVGYLAHGEGWHNNHHADPRSARHGHRWWEIDTTWLTIRLLAALGLAHNVVGPNPHIAAHARTAPVTTRGVTEGDV